MKTSLPVSVAIRRSASASSPGRTEPSVLRLAPIAVLGWLAQAVSLASIGTFAGALILNSVVFDGWGLNFLQFATFGDVALSGLNMIWTARDVLLIVAVGFCLQRWFVGRRLWFLWWLTLGACFCCVVFMMGFVTARSAGEVINVWVLAGYTIGMTLAALWVGLFFWVLYQLLRLPLLPSGIRGKNEFSLCILFTTITLVPLVEAKKLIHTGYHPGLSVLVGECSPLPAQVLWTG